ncbi:hypothetical protein LOTGIDRAFT_239502 [Lottia gigantea]|uniref:Cupin-like domain-containing protein n=1 Tax=Lottia gigantea TaxID=225164 RepID=V4ACQ4_LOTGI|nr:hypothetical protein LOTGIDRAFT_239502 [Lottia gigantea]ESO94627.1 hypothetical protein LOTGIDRAFT_239502 [Lottia gigantea]
MANEDIEILRQVRNEVTELRKLGEDWGMTPSQINNCIEEAFGQNLTIQITEKIAKKIQQGTKWSKVRFAFRLWLAFIIVLFGFAVMVTNTDYLSRAIAKAMQPYGYPLMRAVRLVAVPLHHYNISSYHNNDCLVMNPYFIDSEDDCLCQGITKVRVTKLKKDKELGMQFFQKPILFKGLKKDLVPLQNIIKLVQRETEILKDPSLTVESSVDWMKTIGDFNDLDIETRIYQEKNFHVEWNSRRMSSSQTLRSLFPRPVVYPKKSEIVILKSLYIAGPHSDGIYNMNNGHPANDLFYIQGERTVVFTPRYGCQDVCDSFNVKTEAGDILMFPNSWKVDLRKNTEEMSVSFLGGMA